MDQRKDASEFTRAANAKLLEELPFEDERDFEEAMRGFIAPLSRPTIIEGDSGLILVDPLISTETSRAALELYFEHRPRKRGAGAALRAPSFPIPGTASPDSIRAMTPELLFNYLGVKLNGPKAAGKRIAINFVFTDSGEKAVLELVNGSLNHSLGRTDENADATITLVRPALDRVLLGETTLIAEAESGEISVEPDEQPLKDLLALLDEFDLWFNVVEP